MSDVMLIRKPFIQGLALFLLLREVRMTRAALFEKLRNAFGIDASDETSNALLKVYLLELVRDGSMLLVYDSTQSVVPSAAEGDDAHLLHELAPGQLPRVRNFVLSVFKTLDFIDREALILGLVIDESEIAAACATIAERMKVVIKDTLQIPLEEIADDATLQELVERAELGSEDFAMLLVNIN